MKELLEILTAFELKQIDKAQAEKELRLREWSVKEAERTRIEKWLNADKDGG